MSLWTSSEILKATGGTLYGEAFEVSGIAIDSRDIAPGDLFVGLSGERDGVDFVPAALAAGARAALTTRATQGDCVVVPDGLMALVRLGEAARLRAGHVRRGAVTGSVGKTSVTQAVRAGLERAGAAHGSVQSYNNHIGVPLTLARMPIDTQRAIFEIGMNHAGEITPLALMVRPHAVAITTVEAAHVENFADGEAGVAAAKAEIFAGVERGGVAILNADNRWFDVLKAQARQSGLKVRAFGVVPGTDARLTRFSAAPGGASVEAVIDGRAVEFSILHAATHWGPMSLCVLLMLRALDVDLETGMAALADFAPLAGRGAERRLRGPAGTFTLIDESYNASPVSVAAAISALGARRVLGRRIVVLTDMLELGEQGAQMHAQIAVAIEAAKIDQVFCAGPLMHSLWQALPVARQGAWALSATDLAGDLSAALICGDTVMIKGSKASKASRLVEILAALAQPEEARG